MEHAAAMTSPNKSRTLRPPVMTALGHGVLSLLRLVRGCAQLLIDCVRMARELERPEVFRQAFVMGNRSLFFITVVMSFTGAILVIQASLQAQKVIGDLSPIGPTFLQLLVREFGPTIVAMMVAARYGAGVAAEIGAMTITEQVDALRMAGAEAAPHLVAPRVVAGLIGMPPVAIYGTATAFLAGGAALHYGFGLGWEAYFDTRVVLLSDVIIGLCKCAAFGVAVPLVSSHAGLRAHGGAAGVGKATTRAVIASSITVLALDVAIGGVGYVVARYLVP